MNPNLTQKVAILEPHEILRQCLAEILIYLNYEVVIKSGNTLDFIEQLAMTDDPPQVIISEIELSDVRGLSIFRHFRFHYPEVKLLAFSVDDSEWSVDLALEQGADLFLRKGCSLKSLQQALESIMDKDFQTK